MEQSSFVLSSYSHILALSPDEITASISSPTVCPLALNSLNSTSDQPNNKKGMINNNEISDEKFISSITGAEFPDSDDSYESSQQNIIRRNAFDTNHQNEQQFSNNNNMNNNNVNNNNMNNNNVNNSNMVNDNVNNNNVNSSNRDNNNVINNNVNNNITNPYFTGNINGGSNGHSISSVSKSCSMNFKNTKMKPILPTNKCMSVALNRKSSAKASVIGTAQYPIPKFDDKFLERLILVEFIPILKNDPVLLQIDGPIVVVGDLHGSLIDFLRILIHFDFSKNTVFLFLGDFVDRGQFSIEILTLLFSLKVIYPKRFYFIRGNHEFESVCSSYGFKDEFALKNYILDDKKDDKNSGCSLYRTFVFTFSWFPIAAVIDNKYFCVHGGLSPYLTSLSRISNIKRPLESYQNAPIVEDLVWADIAKTKVSTTSSPSLALSAQTPPPSPSKISNSSSAAVNMSTVGPSILLKNSSNSVYSNSFHNFYPLGSNTISKMNNSHVNNKNANRSINNSNNSNLCMNNYPNINNDSMNNTNNDNSNNNNSNTTNINNSNDNNNLNYNNGNSNYNNIKISIPQMSNNSMLFNGNKNANLSSTLIIAQRQQKQQQCSSPGSSSFGTNTARGRGTTFSEVQLNQFLSKCGLISVIRGHEFIEDGVRMQFNKRFITVFSASCYKKKLFNCSGVLVINSGTYEEKINSKEKSNNYIDNDFQNYTKSNMLLNQVMNAVVFDPIKQLTVNEAVFENKIFSKKNQIPCLCMKVITNTQKRCSVTVGSGRRSNRAFQVIEHGSSSNSSPSASSAHYYSSSSSSSLSSATSYISAVGLCEKDADQQKRPPIPGRRQSDFS